MALQSYVDLEDALKAARVVYDHSQSRMVSRRKTVRKSKKAAFLSAFSMTKSVSIARENIKSPPFPRGKTKLKTNKSQSSVNQTKKKTLVQVFISTPLASTICLQLHPSTSISAVKDLLQDRLGVAPEKQHLFIRKKMELCDALSLEDHCIQQDTNMEMRLVVGLRGGGHGGRKKKKSAKRKEADTKHTSEQPSVPSEGGTANNLEGNSNVKAEGGQTDANAKVKEADAQPEPEGQTRGLDRREGREASVAGGKGSEQSYAPGGGGTTINIEGNKNIVKVEGDQTSISDNVPGLPVCMSEWTSDNVKQWLLNTGVSRSVADELHEGSIDGKVLKMYTKEDLFDDYSKMTKRDMRLILYSREEWLKAEKEQRSPLRRQQEEIRTEEYQFDRRSTGIHIDGDKNKVNVTGDTYVLLMTGVVSNDGQTDDALTSRSYERVYDPEGRQGNSAINDILQNIMRQFDGTVISRVTMGSLKFILLVKSRKGLDSLWAAYTSGELAQKFSEVLVTDELTTGDKSGIEIQLTILESDYEKGCRFFETLEKDPLQGTLPMRMSEWTPDYVKQWLFDIGVSCTLAVDFHEGSIDGKVLEMYTNEDLYDDYSKMTKRDLRLILYSREEWLKAEKQQARRQQEGIQETEHYWLQKSQHSPEDNQVPPLRLTCETNHSAVYHADPSSQPAVRPKTQKARVASSPKKEMTQIVLSPEQCPEATKHDEVQRDHGLKLTEKESIPEPDVPDYHCDTSSQQGPLSQFVGEEHHRIKSPVTETYTKEAPTGDDHTAIMRQMSAGEQTNEARLRVLLTGDKHGELDQSYFPVLIANRPSLPAKDELNTVESQFGFIKAIRWVTVWDFDSRSKLDGLCKLYHDDRMVSLQQPDLFKHIESEEEFRNSIEFPEKTVWVFANGREDDLNIQAPKMTLPDWHKERRKDVEASVTFFSQPSVIPEGRAVIVFLLLSDDDLDILCDTFGKVSSSFKGLQNIVCISQDQELYFKFVSYIKRWLPSEDEIVKRSVVGVQWQEVNRILMRMNGVNQTDKSELPFNSPGKCFLSVKQKDEWNDITVVCKNECENTDMDDTSPSYEQFVKRKELEFYRGEKVDWWNFAIGEKEEKLRRGCGQVLKRRGFGELLRKVSKPLNSSRMEESLIVTVTLLHQPGAGGSTLARHVLWELHKHHRCVVVNRVTNNTVNQILEVRQCGYEKGYSKKIPPVCVLVDNLDDVEVLDLIEDLEEKSKFMHVSGGTVCVLLHCKRNVDPHKMLKAKGKNNDLYVPLTQKLNPTEKEWFQQKYLELEHKEKENKTGDYIPDNLLAFMVMKEEFNKVYIKGVVLRILQDIKGNERKLIKMCSLLNSYIHEADIPISCCDTFMDSICLKGKRILFTRNILNWEKLVSASFKIMVVMTENRTIRMLHKSIAEEALKQTMLESGDQSLADVTLEFLDSELLRSHSYSRKILAKTTHNLLIRRERVGDGEETKTGFSVLIEDVCKTQGSDKAIEILRKGVENLKDAFVAQQLARFYLIKEKNFDMALSFAEVALEINHKNSYFWDTKGRVYKAHFDTLTEPYVIDKQVLGEEVWNDILSLSLEAMRTFRKSYEVSKEAVSTRIEYTGLYAELNVIFRLLQVILLCVEPFRTQGDVNVLGMYLLRLEIPPGVRHPSWDNESQCQVRQLKNRVDEVFEIMDNKTTYYKDGSTANVAGQKLDEMRENMKKYSVIYDRYYGEPQPVHKSRYSDKDPSSLAEHRRRLVEQQHCGSFREIFDHAKAKNRRRLEGCRELLLQNYRDYNSFDLRNIIFIYLALSSIGDQSVSANYVYKQFVRPFYAMDSPKAESCWPSFLLMMFLWPIEGVVSERRDRYDLTEHIMELKDRWSIDRYSKEKRIPQNHERVRRQTRSPMRPRTHFFLGQGEDLRVFAHITELHATERKLDRRDASDDVFWQSDLVKQRLVRLEGTLLNATTLLHCFHKDKDPIEIKLAVPYEKPPSQESVTFYLGFSWNGPVAYDVTLTDKEFRNEHAVQPSFHKAYPDLILSSVKSKVSPPDNISGIGKLQEKREILNKKIKELKCTSEQEGESKKQGKNEENIRERKAYERELEKVKQKLQRAWLQDDIYDESHAYWA
ncbi:sterile alpha motif domain-containing protein 9-like isoform X2 [Acanthaster planci]|uniref:Sterile alpha motif domain-containing protein 9-like isoform X2 n=1 Tax=Acanthaster planci TaxID=133434 RepID=A0A8B7ZUA8_ACAPL|nr:sterile alpha motif domain-containing protein 9-like isoform X2 [Acanthaster planci]